MTTLLDALRFLTRVPVPASASAPGFGAGAFPLVGAALGLLAVLADALLSPFPSALRSVAIVSLWAAITGALHYDGLADVLDALGPSGRDARLRVMRDPAHGTFALLGIVLVVACDLATLGSIQGSARAAALVVAPTLGRLAMLLTAFQASSAREEGLGAEFVRRLEPGSVLAASVTALLVALLAGGVSGVMALVVSVLVSISVRAAAARSFGGVTGDVLGASGKLAESAVLIFWTVA